MLNLKKLLDVLDSLWICWGLRIFYYMTYDDHAFVVLSAGKDVERDGEVLKNTKYFKFKVVYL
jgi:hypothetical protein